MNIVYLQIMKKIIILFIFLPIIGICQTQIGQDIDGELSGDQSGFRVSISSKGDIVAIGAPYNDGNGSNSGHVRVFENISGDWKQIGQDIDGEVMGNLSGYSVSLSSNGTIVAIGAPLNSDGGNASGHVRIFRYDLGSWIQIGNAILGEAIDDWSGYSVSLSSDGSIIAIGAPDNDGNGNNSGHVRIFKNISNVWTQIGSDIDGESSGDLSGSSVSISSDGEILAIGSPRNDGNGIDSGHVRVFQYIAGKWVQIGTDIIGKSAGDNSGFSVSLSSKGDIVAIGSPKNGGNGVNSGNVRVFENVSGDWKQIGQDINGEAVDDMSGSSVSLSSKGDIVAIGAPNNDGNGNNSGHVRIYQNVLGTWTKNAKDIDGEFISDLSGSSISLASDGKAIVIGAPRNSGNGNNSGQVRVYDLSNIIVSSDNFVLNNFNLFPNPTSHTLNIELRNDLFLHKVVIYDDSGKIMRIMHEEKIYVGNLDNGTYIVEIFTNRGKVAKKIIIKK